ncbi:glycosyltransferase [Aureimonas leprariae]|uniref:Tetratricopeptide repeat protein n=1 Tax=Plantimonas leprariae TaxID=2615207 RepID=A0A7V7TVZ3_9HYPH|nr:tetratricopeptide repeat protein [Aureimonas leprariae]KAB0679027.1 tetratricopeptide repeat protein [Aureimonas leprariae]
MSFEAERQAGIEARAAGRREDALGHFRAALALRPAELGCRCDAAGELIALGRLAEAEIEARLGLDAVPGFAPLHRALALALRARGDRAGALDAFRAAARADPRDLWHRHDIGMELRALGREAEADAAFGAVAAGTPLPHALRALGESARSRGEGDAALALFAAAARLLPADPWFALDVAVALRVLDRLAEAETATTALLAAHPGFVPGACERAELLLRLDRAPEAETLYARLLVSDPSLVAAYRGLARIAAARGDAMMAAAHLAGAVRARPADAALRLEWAAALKRAGRWVEAEPLLRGLLGPPTTAVSAQLELYPIVKRRAGHAAALALLEAARDLDPRHPRALLMLGDHARERGDLAAAERWYDATLDASPHFYWALVGRAATARARDDTAGAFALLEAAAGADPHEHHATIELAALHRENGDFAAARAALGRVPADSPRAGEAALAAALVLRAEGRWDAAAAAFLDAAERFPARVEALVEAAEDFARAGADEAAARALDAARRRDPDHPAVLDILARRALSRDDYDAARAHLGRAIALDPGRLWPPLGLARIRATLGDIAGTLADLDACEARFGGRPEIAEARIALLRQTGERNAARDRVGEARRLYPHHAGLRQEAVLLALDEGRFADAEAPLAGTIAQEGARLLFLRSLVHAARFDMEAAIRLGEAALAALPGDGWLRNRVIHAALVDLDLDRAGRHLAALAALEAVASRAKGKSANASQSHYGQIYDEFRLDREAVAAVRQARVLPAERRLAALAAVVAAFPDSTAAAIRYFVERRSSPPPPPDPARMTAIPQVIHQYWNDPVPPADLALYAASWRDLHPRHRYRLWNEAEARAVLAGVSTEALRAFERAREPAMKADLFRLALLFEAGGIYADMDDRCLASLEPLLVAGHSMVVYQEDLGSLGNNLIAATARHPVIGRALRLGVEAVNRGDSDILWLATGPGLLTRAAAQVLGEGGAPELLVLDRPALGAHVAIHCLAGYKATERHWSRTAFGRARSAQAARVSAA